MILMRLALEVERHEIVLARQRFGNQRHGLRVRADIVEAHDLDTGLSGDGLRDIER
jgi:hypothetical protein